MTNIFQPHPSSSHPPPLPPEESQCCSLRSPASHKEWARSLGSIGRPPPVMLTTVCQIRGRVGGRTGINRYNSTHSTWRGMPCHAKHTNALPGLAHHVTPHMPMFCLAQPGKWRFLYLYLVAAQRGRGGSKGEDLTCVRSYFPHTIHIQRVYSNWARSEQNTNFGT